jgi:hypothetical protein
MENVTRESEVMEERQIQSGLDLLGQALETVAGAVAVPMTIVSMECYDIDAVLMMNLQAGVPGIEVVASAAEAASMV